MFNFERSQPSGLQVSLERQGGWLLLFADVMLVKRKERLSSIVYFIALPQGHFLSDA